MIITSYRQLEIGKVYSDKDKSFQFEMMGTFPKQWLIKVIREVTEQEFIDYIKETYPNNWNLIQNQNYFYEVQTD